LLDLVDRLYPASQQPAEVGGGGGSPSVRATELAQLNPALSGPGAGATPRQTAEHSRLQISAATASLRTTTATRNRKPTLTGEPYEAYIRRIADAPGPAGKLART
jgi:hypothetical protein